METGSLGAKTKTRKRCCSGDVLAFNRNTHSRHPAWVCALRCGRDLLEAARDSRPAAVRGAVGMAEKLGWTVAVVWDVDGIVYPKGAGQ